MHACVCVHVCMCVVTKHQLYHVYLCLPWKPLGLQWTRQYLNTCDLIHQHCGPPAAATLHEAGTQIAQTVASIQPPWNLTVRFNTADQNPFTKMIFMSCSFTSSWKQGCMQEALHGLAHSLLGSKCRRAWNNLVESRAQYPRNCAAIAIFSDFFWNLVVLISGCSFRKLCHLRKRNLKVPEAGFAGQARIPGTSPQNLWPTTSAVLLNISYHTSIHAIWSYWVTGQDQPAWPRRPYSFTRMPKRKVLKARVRLSGTVHSVEIRNTLHEARSRAANRRTNWDAGRSHGS